MPSKTKRCSCLTHAVLLLAMILMMSVAALSVRRAGGENAVSLDAHSATPPVGVRTAPANSSQQRLAEERARVNFVAGKRDPFEVPHPPKADAAGDHPDGPLPPGVRGLVIRELHLEGIVRDEESGNMIAMVTNSSNLAYFLHLHDEVSNGAVSRIAPDAIYCQQKTTNSRGRIEAREVVLRLGPERQEAR